MHKERHVAQVEGIVFEAELGIFYQRVHLLLGVLGFLFQLVGLVVVLCAAVGVVVFLEHIPQVEVAELLGGHHRVSFLVFFLQLGEVEGAFGV